MSVFNSPQEKIVQNHMVLHGVDIHTGNDWAICIASYNGSLEIVKWLFRHGVGVRVRNDTPICWASEKGQLETVKWLFSPNGVGEREGVRGADIRAPHDLPIFRAS